MGGRTTERPTPPTFDHLPKKQPRRVRVPINFSEDAAEELAEAEAALVLSGELDRPSALARLDRARKAAADATVVVVFQALGKPAYRELVKAHPPTAEQMAEYDKAVAAEAEKPLGERAYVERPPFDLETFGPALIAAACVSHAMTAAEVAEEINSERWNITEVQRLWDGAFDAQTTASRTTVGKGSGPTPS